MRKGRAIDSQLNSLGMACWDPPLNEIFKFTRKILLNFQRPLSVGDTSFDHGHKVNSSLDQ